MKRIAESLNAEVGKTYDKSDVKIMIKKIQTEKLEKAGYKNIIDKSICDTSVRNYSALLANEGNIAISQSYLSKSNTRYAAENSIRGSIATLGVIAATHFISVEEEDTDIRSEMKLLPESTRKLYDIVTDFFGSLMNSASCKILTVFYPRIPITFSNVLDSLCAKERTWITMETKETLFAEVR